VINLTIIADVLYDIANHERNLEIERTEKLETKAQRFTTFGGIFISIISTYFIITTNTSEGIALLIKIILIGPTIIFGISLFLLLLSMRITKYKTFNVESLTHEVENDDPKNAISKIIGNFIQFTKFMRNLNDNKTKFLAFGIYFFFGGLFCMIAGIIIMVVVI